MPDMELIRKAPSDDVFYIIGDRENALNADRALNGAVTLVSVKCADWNHELSPWKAEKCFRNGEDFGGGAGEYIARIAENIPAFEERSGISPANRVLCGYSLAGLCALYAMYETDMFSGAVSASGSMWFDGWLDFMENNRPARAETKVCLSVGDREARTRNPRLASVEECTRRACGILKSQGYAAEFTLNPGNHFCEPDIRLARGIARMLEMLK